MYFALGPLTFAIQLLNNFLPKFVDNGLPQQQDQIREWLLKDTGPVSPWVAGIMSRQQQREKDLANSLALSMGRPPPVPAAREHCPF